MGRHTDPAVIGSRRAAVVTLTVSALLVIGGFVTLHEAGDLRPGRRPHPSHATVASTADARRHRRPRRHRGVRRRRTFGG